MYDKDLLCEKLSQIALRTQARQQRLSYGSRTCTDTFSAGDYTRVFHMPNVFLYNQNLTDFRHHQVSTHLIRDNPSEQCSYDQWSFPG